MAFVRLAAIDVGSNSVLLTVMDRIENGWQTVFEKSIVTALGRGTKTTGLLNAEAMFDTLTALRVCFDLAEELKADRIMAAGTMALRIASNTATFLELAAAQLTPVSILSAEDEARLGFESVASDPTFCDAPTLTIVDPGGHSTEFVTAVRAGDGWKTLVRRSVAVGAIGLRDSLENPDSPTTFDRLNMVDQIDGLIGLCYLPFCAGRVVVLGATGTNLVSVRDKLAEWDPGKVHGATLEFEEIGRATGWLMDMTGPQRRALVGMEPGREDTIHLGTLILERFLQAFGAESCQVSVRGWRHALIQESYRVAAGA